MRADAIRDAPRLTLRSSTTRTHEVHQGIADRTFRAAARSARPGPARRDRRAEAEIQAGMDRLAANRTLPILG